MAQDISPPTQRSCRLSLLGAAIGEALNAPLEDLETFKNGSREDTKDWNGKERAAVYAPYNTGHCVTQCVDGPLA